MFYLGMIQCVKHNLLFTFAFFSDILCSTGDLCDFQQVNTPSIFKHHCPEQAE